MNFLAHAQLSGNPLEFVIGSIVGEYIRGGKNDLPFLFGCGVRHHRLVDIFTDKHNFVLNYKSRVNTAYRRYCGIVLDIYCDYLLIQNWEELAEQSIDVFIEDLYRGIQEHSWRVAERYQPILHSLVDDDWLRSYSSFEGIFAAVQRIEDRLGASVGLENILIDMHANEKLKKDFIPFYQDLSIYAAGQRRILIND